MADGSNPLCFTCGLPFGDAARLNHLPSGQVCPSCRDRLLETLPAPFPASPGARSHDAPEPASEAPSEPVREFVSLPRSERSPDDYDDYRPEPA